MNKKLFGLIAISSILLASCDYPVTSSTNTDNKNIISSSEDNKETNNNKENNSTSEVTDNTKGDNSSISSSSEKEKLLNCGAYEEGMFAYWEGSINNLVKVEYANALDRNFVEIDKELIRVTDNNLIRADVVGISEGDYILRVTKDNGIILESDILNVGSYDRSGYAHFEYEKDNTGVNVNDGIGAYTNNGTLKENAKVLYVTDDTKNSVKLTIEGKEYEGLLNILNAQQYSTVPLDVRILGSIKTVQWNKKEALVDENKEAYMVGSDGKIYKETLTDDQIIEYGINSYSDDLAKGITKLNGLSSKASYSKKEYDSAWNNGNVKSAQNLTVEGIGNDATLFQWGFTWKACKSLEVRNLIFDDYTEDACGIEGSVSSTNIENFAEGHIWVHNNVFEQGVNNWDITMEQDKHEGDGATDLKKIAFITLSYNHYHNNHKTGLVGGGNTQLTSCITFHHNWYEKCSSRLPLAREANMHMYNNYYDGSTGTNMSLRANAYAFIEGCYFENCNNPISIDEKTGSGQGDNKDEAGNKIKFDFYKGQAKIYNCDFVQCKGQLGGVFAKVREEAVENTNLYSQTFDTDSSIFYYDNTLNKTNAYRLTSALTAKDDCINLSGVHR